MDATLRIKNLSIALEALSRVNTDGSLYLYISVEMLLKKEIQEVEKETQWPQRGPAKPTVYDKDPYAKDDDISF
jgi:hypothetical protein